MDFNILESAYQILQVDITVNSSILFSSAEFKTKTEKWSILFS